MKRHFLNGVGVLVGLLLLTWSSQADAQIDFSRMPAGVAPPNESRTTPGASDFNNLNRFSVETESGRVPIQGAPANESRTSVGPQNFNNFNRFNSLPGDTPPQRFVAPTPPAEVFSNQPITLRVPSGAEQPCAYRLNVWDFNMTGGQKQIFNEDRQWVIRYEPAPGREATQYRLRAGEYEFRLENGAWQLYRL